MSLASIFWLDYNANENPSNNLKSPLAFLSLPFVSNIWKQARSSSSSVHLSTQNPTRARSIISAHYFALSFLFSGWWKSMKNKNNNVNMSDEYVDYQSGPSPQHLLVLVHGFQGDPRDFGSIIQELKQKAHQKNASVLIHVSHVNKGKTKDGIEKGGRRIAHDILDVVSANQSLSEISIVGFSLGGLYSRYAIALLYDKEKDLIAGLKPKKFITLASPHLGVREFGAYNLIPTFMMGMISIFLGDTGPELFLIDKGRPSRLNLLEEMTLDHQDMPFIQALQAFERRYLYGNVKNDLLVPYGTATLKPHIRELKQGPHLVPQQASILDASYDQLGCRIWYRHYHPMALDPSEGTMRTATEMSKGEEMRDRQSGLRSELSNHNPQAYNNTHSNQDESLQMEFETIEIMSNRLTSIGWTVIAVDFDINIPIAHNRIVAMPRNPIHRWLNQGGARAVSHVVDTLLDEATIIREGQENEKEGVVNLNDPENLLR